MGSAQRAPKMEVVAVNKRVLIPDTAATGLSSLFQAAQRASDAAEVYLSAVAATLGIPRASIIGFDDDTKELVLDSADEGAVPGTEQDGQ